MLVPSPAFRSMSLGIMLAVVFVMADTLTLLPALLTKLCSYGYSRTIGAFRVLDADAIRSIYEAANR